MENRNIEIQDMDRITQIERMGVRHYRAEFIFKLECLGRFKEAKSLLYAATNVYLNPKYELALQMKYWMMLTNEELDRVNL